MPAKTPQKGSEKKRKGKSIKERRKEKRLKRDRAALFSTALEP
jgi:hypothetical protein